LITCAVALLSGVGGALVSARLTRRIKSEPVDHGSRFHDVFVTRSLDKALKHLRRIASSSGGEVRDKADDLLRQAHELSALAQRKADPQAMQSTYKTVERIFVYLQVLSACFIAFAHGANDVANAIGPLSAAVQALREGVIAAKAEIRVELLALGGFGIVVGLATWGWRVIQTIGRRITELTPSRGFCAEFATAMTILIATISPVGIPVSTTHILVGAVLGVGIARGIGAINLNT